MINQGNRRNRKMGGETEVRRMLNQGNRIQETGIMGWEAEVSRMINEGNRIDSCEETEVEEDKIQGRWDRLGIEKKWNR